MLYLCLRIYPCKTGFLCPMRKLSKFVNIDKSSRTIRQKFIDYFIMEHNHNFVKSSPVVPFCDPTVAFVNAGMNQFKGILLGNQEPAYAKVANYQKCVRIGGKHNDLCIVGSDGYHHTFFEMLGSWSFGDYYKHEACKLAWNLLVDGYKLPKSNLYVTYFRGDERLGLYEDVETKEIWKKIGVSEDRIIPFGANDNFWEMGPIGPCGPCTEIHVDRRGSNNRSRCINKGLPDLTEIWNIVFIEYNMNLDRSLTALPKKHVDTGMGFERLTAIMQGTISNYDTDNFIYLLHAIQKNSNNAPDYGGKFGEADWNNLDSNYRILADHARMITVCLSDGVIPEQNQKLRRLLRKTFLISETVFKKESGLLKELANYVVENLGSVYPELEKNIKQVQQIIDYEEEVYKSIRNTAVKEWNQLKSQNPKLESMDVIETPGIIAAYKNIMESKTVEIDSNLAFKLYDSFGLDEQIISKLSEALNLKFNPEDLTNELEKAKIRSKDSGVLLKNYIYNALLQENIKKTDDSFKYGYRKENNVYVFQTLPATVLKLIKDNSFVNSIDSGIFCSVLLNKTNFYTEAGGQMSDKGVISFTNNIFNVVEVQNLNGYILHNGYFNKSFTLKPNLSGGISVSQDVRISMMRNHTATHILNSILKDLKGATCQKSSKVTDSFLKLDLAIFANKFTAQEVGTIEQKIQNIIKSNLPVVVHNVNSQQLLNYTNVTLIPGEIYPETDIRLIEINNHDNFLSLEPCCGTHVHSTGDIEDFSIIALKSLGRSTASITAVTGDTAKQAKLRGQELLAEISLLESNREQATDEHIPKLRQKLKDSSFIVPTFVRQQCIEKLEKVAKQIKDSRRNTLNDLVKMEMQNAIHSNISKTKSNKDYLVHYLRSSLVFETVSLQKATKCCPDIPVLVISYIDGYVKARCCVPKDFTSGSFDAEKWLKETVAEVFKSKITTPTDQDARLVCNMNKKRVHMKDWDTLLSKSLETAKQYIEDKL